MQKLFDDFCVFFKEISLHCGNMGIVFINLVEIMGIISSDKGGIMDPKFEPKWHVPAPNLA